ncbi:MAG: bile acid:sodium symporter family protein, partial [Bacteroidota bacterium]
MKNLSVYKIVLFVSLLCLLAVVLFGLTGHISEAGPLCISFFITLAIGVRGYAHLKGFTYTITIFAAVTTAMYYPFYFLQWNGFKLATLITPLIQLIMFGMGTSMGL